MAVPAPDGGQEGAYLATRRPGRDSLQNADGAKLRGGVPEMRYSLVSFRAAEAGPLN